MIYAALVIGVLVLLGLVLLGWAVMTAPLGYEDEDGFHHGEPRPR